MLIKFALNLKIWVYSPYELMKCPCHSCWVLRVLPYMVQDGAGAQGRAGMMARLRALPSLTFRLPCKPWWSLTLSQVYLNNWYLQLMPVLKGNMKPMAWISSLDTSGLKCLGHLNLSHEDWWLHGAADLAQVLWESCALPEVRAGRTLRASQAVPLCRQLRWLFGIYAR